MTRLVRVLAPAITSGQNPITVNGRTYTAAAGATLDVPDTDAAVLGANSWVVLGLVGPTTSRPARGDSDAILAQGPIRFIDTTIAKTVVYDAAANVWRDSISGAVA